MYIVKNIYSNFTVDNFLKWLFQYANEKNIRKGILMILPLLNFTSHSILENES